MNKFGSFLKKEIARNKLSQNKFAKELGDSSYYVGQLIKGEKKPPSRKLQTKIANVLNFDESKRIEFFNMTAKEKSDIPSDIYDGVISNESKWNDVRKILSEGENKNDQNRYYIYNWKKIFIEQY